MGKTLPADATKVHWDQGGDFLGAGRDEVATLVDLFNTLKGALSSVGLLELASDGSLKINPKIAGTADELALKIQAAKGLKSEAGGLRIGWEDLPSQVNISTLDSFLLQLVGAGNSMRLLKWQNLLDQLAGSGLVRNINKVDVVFPGSFILHPAQATTSGTEVDFTGISATAKRLTLLWKGFSLNGAGQGLVRIGHAGGFEVAGYVSNSLQANAGGSSGGVSATDGFVVMLNSAANAFKGRMVIEKVTGDEYASAHSGKCSASQASFGGGDKILSDTLTQVRVTATAGTLDGGSVALLEES